LFCSVSFYISLRSLPNPNNPTKVSQIVEVVSKDRKKVGSKQIKLGSKGHKLRSKGTEKLASKGHLVQTTEKLGSKDRKTWNRRQKNSAQRTEKVGAKNRKT
jgi:hypothetical protein